MFKNKKEVISYFKTKINNGDVQGYEVVLTLVTLVFQKKVSYDDACEVLSEVYGSNLAEALIQLDMAYNAVDKVADKLVSR